MAATTEAQIESSVESTYDAASLPAAIITRAFGTISNVGERRHSTPRAARWAYSATSPRTTM